MRATPQVFRSASGSSDRRIVVFIASQRLAGGEDAAWTTCYADGRTSIEGEEKVKNTREGIVNGNLAWWTDGVVGIAGFGHLGRSLAAPLVRNGFPKDRLLISYRGSETTHRAACNLGLDGCLTSTEDLLMRADVAVVATRPQDALSLTGFEVKRGALIVSCMAGLSVDLLELVFRTEVKRMMCSGPDSILEGRGIATLYPYDERVESLLELMRLRVYATSDEAELDSFTIGICIPAMLLNVRADWRDVRTALRCMELSYPVYGALQNWIDDIMPETLQNGAEVETASVRSAERLKNVSTRGGVTEAMMNALRQGSGFGEALQIGIERGREIRDEVRDEVMRAIRLAG